MKKLALALALTGAATFSTGALAMGGCNYDGGGYKHTLNTSDEKKDAALFADNDKQSSKTATQQK